MTDVLDAAVDTRELDIVDRLCEVDGILDFVALLLFDRSLIVELSPVEPQCHPRFLFFCSPDPFVFFLIAAIVSTERRKKALARCAISRTRT
jgi:hypothetical protein